MQVVVDSLLTNYHLSGKGKTILLLHGWGDSIKGLDALINTLDSEYKVVAIDLPGFGGTQPPLETWGINEYSIFVHHFIEKLKLDVYAVVGHSNGGAIAIRGLASGIKSNRLVLIASAGIRNTYKGRVKALRYITKAGKLATTPLPSRIKNKLRQKVYTSIGSDMLVAEHLQETFKRVVEDDVRSDAEKIKIPTLLIYGENDQSTPLSYARIFKDKISGSKLEIIPNAGHMLPTENTTQLSQLITGFLK